MPRNIGGLNARASRMIGKTRLVDAVSRSADQDEAPVAIAAIDIAMLVDLEEYARMAKRRAARNVAGAITGDTVVADAEGFRRGDHEARIARWDESGNLPSPFPLFCSPPAEREGSSRVREGDDQS